MPCSRPMPDRLTPPNGELKSAAYVLTENVPVRIAPRDLEAVGHVGREDAAGQPVVAVVGDPDRVLLVVVRDHDDDGAEDLLLRDGHVVADVRQQRRLDEPALGQVLGDLAAGGELAPSSTPLRT